MTSLCCFIMCAKSRSAMTVPTLRNDTELEPLLQNAKLPLSSDVKTVGVKTGRMAINFLHVNSPSSPMRRLDLLSWEAMVIPANQRGQTARPTGRAKTGGQRFAGNCFLWGKPGHRASECPSRGRLQSLLAQVTEQQDPSKN